MSHSDAIRYGKKVREGYDNIAPRGYLSGRNALRFNRDFNERSLKASEDQFNKSYALQKEQADKAAEQQKWAKYIAGAGALGKVAPLVMDMFGGGDEVAEASGGLFPQMPSMEMEGVDLAQMGQKIPENFMSSGVSDGGSDWLGNLGNDIYGFGSDIVTNIFGGAGDMWDSATGYLEELLSGW